MAALQSLRAELDRDGFLESREKLTSNGYELFGLRSEGKIVCVAGLMFTPHVLRGRDCRVFDLVTLEAERSNGFGKELVRFIEQYAKDQGCTRVDLHTQLDRTDSRRFYEEHVGWEECACVYKKELARSPGRAG